MPFRRTQPAREAASPPRAPRQILAYISDRRLRLQIANGLRMAVVALLPVFAVGVYIWIGPPGGGWRIVRMLGIATVPVIGIIAVTPEWAVGLAVSGFALLLVWLAAMSIILLRAGRVT